MSPVPADLPDDVDALKAMILAMAQKSAAADAEIADLKRAMRLPTSASSG